jgi:hypothetical protein
MILNAQILNRFDSAANWVSENPTLASGEVGVQSDGHFKVGDGTTAWGDLDFAGGSAELNNYLLADGTRELAGHLLPEMTGASGVVSARDIGSSDQKIRNLYVHDAYIDAGSLYVNNKLVLQDDSGTITISTDADQDLKVKTTGTGDVVFQSENEVNSVAKGGIEFTVPSDNPTKHINFTNQSTNGNLTFSAAGTGSQIQFTALDEIDLTATNIDINGAMDVSGEITFGTLHHHNLTGISDDDHSQYILATGARAFTGKVTGVTPTETNQLATKSYVDSAVQGLDWQESVLDITTNALATATTGFRYISSETSGGWTINNIYEYNGATWDETAASEGFAAWVEDEDILYTFNGSAWVKFGSTITHENLNAVNGGTYRHLSAAHVTELTTSGSCTIHTHAGGGLPSGAIILVESDTAITGFTLLTDTDDGVAYITKGSAAAGESGGSSKTSGTWTQPNHIHSGPSHTHTGPSHVHGQTSHTHAGPNHNHQWNNYISIGTTSQSYNSAGTATNYTAGTQNTYVTHVAADTGNSGTVINQDCYTTKVAGTTGGASAANTGAGGTAATGAAGTANTGNGASASTWRPKGTNYTRQQKI